MTAASSTEPTVGAAVWASGSHVCSGHIGTLTANPRNIAPNTSQPKRPGEDLGECWPRFRSERGCRMSAPAAKTRAEVHGQKAEEHERRTEEREEEELDGRVEPGLRLPRESRDLAGSVLSPQIPIMKYIGSRTTSKKMKKSTRSSAANVPFIPVARISIRIRNALGLRGSSQWFHE